MSLNKHITRNFNANKTNIIRMDGEESWFEIFKYDKTQDMIITASSDIPHNGHQVWFDGMTGLKVGKGSEKEKKEVVQKSINEVIDGIWKSAQKKAKKKVNKMKGISTAVISSTIASEIERVNNLKAISIRSVDKKYLTLSFKYDAQSSSSHYRIEVLYTNTYKVDGDDRKYRDCVGEIYVNGSPVNLNETSWTSNDMTYNRYQTYCAFRKGKNDITVSLSPNMVFYGLIIRRYYVWESHYPLLNDDQLVPIEAEASHTDEFKINTMTCKFMYDHALDEALDPTNENANLSGLVFDYRDEINWYVKDTTGREQQVFGGYISTANVDDKLTEISLECNDRIMDLDRRYCVSEILMGDADEDADLKYTFANDCLKRFDTYSDAIEFLSNMAEIPLMNNLTLGKPLVPRKTKILRTYKKGANDKLTMDNMDYTIGKKCLTLRNGIDRNRTQAATIFHSDKGVLLNQKPILFMNYGLGEPEYDEEVTETYMVVKQKGVAKNVTNQADDATKNITDQNKIAYALWKWIANNIKHTYTENFYQTPSKTLSSKKGNCCCKAELLLDMCNYKGITDLKYIHVKKSPHVGHVFCRINGKIVDPSIKSGWGNYSKFGGYMNKVYTKETIYPTKPF